MIQLYKQNLARAQKAYSAALSPRGAEGASTPRIKNVRKGEGTWENVPQSNRAATTMAEPAANTARFSASKATDSQPWEGFSARRLSEDCERDARRYERML